MITSITRVITAKFIAGIGRAANPEYFLFLKTYHQHLENSADAHRVVFHIFDFSVSMT